MAITKCEAPKVKRGSEMVPTATRSSILTINSQDKAITGVVIDPQSKAVTPSNEPMIPIETMFRRSRLGTG
ncbi:uncharacterized protein ACHE_70846S [Aspergillus chevalieri]|uniref:Uncharacterized protein n=1 Tax=Aspergillus chevalieri TaxID=182096 RepID=A0A7R7VXC5_ASPCH|nr:uncharacterized protein ACHE_70846S [Aspergillus chevalieri]BCR92003.1 hypothetical protein ACHE_70846S [Aspergillus chevalieri]